MKSLKPHLFVFIIEEFQESENQSLMFDIDPRSGTISIMEIREKSVMEDLRSNSDKDSRGFKS